MGRALSRDLRDRVLAAVDGGVSCRRAAERFGVSASGIRWQQLALAHGTPAGKPQGGDRRTAKIEDHAGFILEAIKQEPDPTFAELQAMLVDRGVCLDRRHLPEGARGRPDRLDRGDSGGRCQHARQARSAGRRKQSVRGRDFLEELPAFARRPWPARREARHLRRPQACPELRRRGLRGAAGKVFNSTQQRCRVHWMRNALAHVGPKQSPAVVAMLKTIFAQESADAAHEQWRHVADALRERYEKLALMMDGSREEVLAYMGFPKEHWAQISSTDEIDKTSESKMCYGPCARATP